MTSAIDTKTFGGYAVYLDVWNGYGLMVMPGTQDEETDAGPSLEEAVKRAREARGEENPPTQPWPWLEEHEWAVISDDDGDPVVVGRDPDGRDVVSLALRRDELGDYEATTAALAAAAGVKLDLS